MKGKIIVSVFFVVLIAIFAYYYIASPQISKEPSQALEDITGKDVRELRAFTGTIAEISNENLLLRANGDILTIKKSANTRYFALIDNIRTAIDGNDLKQNEKATVVVSVGSNYKMTALSFTVVR